MKNILLALVIAIVLINCFGSVVDNILDMNIVMLNELPSPLQSMVVLSIVAVVLAVVGFLAAVSIVGTILVGLVVGFIALLTIGVSAFWPLIIVAIALYALGGKNAHWHRDKCSAHTPHDI